MKIFYDCGIHFLGGISFSGIDRLFSKNASRFSQERIKDKHSEAVALDYLVSHNSETDGASEQYRDAILKSREYFENTGRYNTKKALTERVVNCVKSFSTDASERVNNLFFGKKLAFAYGAELAGDLGVFISSLTTGVGDGVVAVAETSYQGLSFFAGLQAGRAVLYFKDLFRSKQEKELDGILNELTKDGKLLELVKNYSQTARLEIVDPKEDYIGETNEPSDVDDKPSDYGAKAGTKFADAIESVGSVFSSGIGAIRDRIQERRDKKNAEDERKRKELREKYDKY